MKKTLLMTLAALGTMTATAYAGTVTVNGSTTVLPAMQQVTESFMAAHPDVTVTISGSGSGNGIKALRDKMLRDKMTDIAMSSRDLKSKEVKDFESHGMKTTRYTVAHDAIIPVVHNNNAVKGLTMAQLRDVFAGKIKNWKEVGGADRPIVVVGRDSSSGTFESWQELVMGKTRVSPRAQLQSSSGGVVQAVASNENAIGYIGIGYMDKQTKALEVDGKVASMQSAKDRTWPIARDLYLFTVTESADAKKLLDYALSAEGQKFVEKSGFVPVN